MNINPNCLNCFIDKLIRKLVSDNNNYDVFNDNLKNDMKNVFEQFMLEDIGSNAECHEMIMDDINDYVQYLINILDIQIDIWDVIYLYRFTLVDFYNLNFNICGV